MTKKYDSKDHSQPSRINVRRDIRKSFWSKLATLLAPQDDAVMRSTRDAQKAPKEDEPIAERKRRPLATPSFDQQLSLIQTFE